MHVFLQKEKAQLGLQWVQLPPVQNCPWWGCAAENTEAVKAAGAEEAGGGSPEMQRTQEFISHHLLVVKATEQHLVLGENKQSQARAQPKVPR